MKTRWINELTNEEIPTPPSMPDIVMDENGNIVEIVYFKPASKITKAALKYAEDNNIELGQPINKNITK